MPAPPGYDPTGWSATDPATWPPPIPPATLYQPGMVWTITAPGTVDGQPVAVGDLLFAVHRARRFGDGAYGSSDYGSPPGANWTTDEVAFLAWYASRPPDHQPPYPYTGCPFGTTGWWIIIESFFTEATRTYGQATYGSEVYGGSDGTPRWRDITPGFVEITINRGNPDGGPTVDATEISAVWYDPDFAGWNLSPPASFARPFVGDPLRVSFYDPVWRWYPRAVGEIERITDAAGAPPRFVAVEAFGHLMDLDRTLYGWQRPAELASARFAALLAAAGWRWGTAALVYPPDVQLHADVKARDVKARAEIDRTCLSAGWLFDTDRYGTPRLRQWPLALVPPATAVVDCNDHGHPGAVATTITYTADESQLLNIVAATNMLEPPTLSRVVDDSSVAIYGGRDNSLGFPAEGLAFATKADGDALVARVLARQSRIITHVDPVAADTLVDPAWLPILAAVDTGEQWTITRVHPDPFTIDGIVVALEEQITPDRIEASVSTATTTPTS